MPSSYRCNHATSGDIRIHEVTLSPKCRKPTSPWESVHRSCCTYPVNLSTTHLSVGDAPDVTPSASSNPADTVCVLTGRVLDRLLLDIKDPEVCGWMCSSNSKNREYRRRNHPPLLNINSASALLKHHFDQEFQEQDGIVNRHVGSNAVCLDSIRTPTTRHRGQPFSKQPRSDLVSSTSGFQHSNLDRHDLWLGCFHRATEHHPVLRFAHICSWVAAE